MMSDVQNIFNVYTESSQKPQLHVNEQGTKQWKLNGNFHREDGPAIEYPDGTKEWYQHGKLHRVNAPAVEFANGNGTWFLHGELHRDDGPAVEYGDGGKEWWVDGKRCDDVAAWAKAALKYNYVEPTQDNIDAKVAEVMQQDLFD